MRIQIANLVLSWYEDEYKDVIVDIDSLKVITKKGRQKQYPLHRNCLKKINPPTQSTRVQVFPFLSYRKRPL